MQFAASFALGYLAQSDVKCYVEGELDGSGNQVYRTMTWISDTLFEMGGSAPAMGAIVVVERTTNKNALINEYGRRVPITSKNLDQSFKQSIMAVHEALDGRFGTLAVDLDMGNNQIKNLAPATEPTDAVTLGQLGGYPQEAEAFAIQAMGYRDEAEGYKNAATTQAGIATTKATESSDFATASAASSDRSQEWAEKATDVAVIPGSFSSKHWATKAQGYAASINPANITITGGTITGITDLAIADGGTGASTASAAFSNLKQAATTSATGVVQLGTTAEVKAGTASKVALISDINSNYGSVKAAGFISGLAVIQGSQSFGIASTSVSAGVYSVTLSVTMADTNYPVHITIAENLGCTQTFKVFNRTTTSFQYTILQTCDTGHANIAANHTVSVTGKLA